MAKKRLGKKLDKKMAQKKEPRKFAPIKLPKKLILQFAMVFVLIPSFYALTKNSPYFKLADIRIIDREETAVLAAEDLSRLYKGRNIFDIDIDSLARRIKNDRPVIERAVVRRILPNMLEVEIIPRLPVAVLQSHEKFPVDRTGMVLSPTTKTRGLPAISGLSIWLNPRIGERLEGKQLESAFLLLDALKETGFPSTDNVTAIDVTNYRNLSFYLEDGIEVKIGDKDFPDRLRLLKGTLAKPGLDRDNIKYIDLRFRDVVIGPK